MNKLNGRTFQDFGVSGHSLRFWSWTEDAFAIHDALGVWDNDSRLSKLLAGLSMDHETWGRLQALWILRMPPSGVKAQGSKKNRPWVDIIASPS